MSSRIYFKIGILAILIFNFLIYASNNSTTINIEIPDLNSSTMVDNKNIKLLIKIGHIGAIGVMPKAENILDICRKDLWNEGILDENFDVK